METPPTYSLAHSLTHSIFPFCAHAVYLPVCLPVSQGKKGSIVHKVILILNHVELNPRFWKIVNVDEWMDGWMNKQMRNQLMQGRFGNLVKMRLVGR